MDAGLAVHLNVTLSWELSVQEVVLSLYGENTMDFLLCLLQGKEWMAQSRGPCESCVFKLVCVTGSHVVDPRYCFFDQSKFS